MGSLQLDPFVVAVIIGMSVATYATKAGGLWLLGRVSVSDRTEAGLGMLPGAIIMAILGPELISVGPAGWGVAVVVLLLMWRTENVLLALLCGVAAVLLCRNLL
ncbi:AzlD family protein [Natrinema salifodinae]|uniref:AzlD family protein n=1 Tax=Natrinema salifodinae TaxID=1202768 RepID=UPI00067929DD|nr:AzlD domain-containing protein [Natrinema salifodinae]